MAEGWIHDLVHEILQGANQQAGDSEFHEIGHVIEYDEKKHMCRVLLTGKRADDDSGEEQILETGWCQVGTTMVGDGWGLQYALKGGATKDNPELGEQVQVSIQNTDSGLRAVANLTFNDTMKPPGAGDDPNSDSTSDGWDQDPHGLKKLEAREFVLRHESGSFLKFYKSGDVQLFTAQNLYCYVKNDMNVDVREGDLNVTVEQGNLNVNVDQGDASVTVSEGDLMVEVTMGNAAISAGTDIELNADEDIRITAGQDINIEATGNVNITADTGDVNITSA